MFSVEFSSWEPHLQGHFPALPSQHLAPFLPFQCGVCVFLVHGGVPQLLPPCSVGDVSVPVLIFHMLASVPRDLAAVSISF